MRRSTAPSFRGLKPATAAASRAKKANLKKDTKHELVLRAQLWKLGLRFRKHVADLPGSPDLVFKKAKVVVFCDGDFWHGRDWPRLRRKLKHRHNADYWIAKIRRNRARDRAQAKLLTKAGWKVLRFWETDILKDPVAVAAQISEQVLFRLPNPQDLSNPDKIQAKATVI
jgi:DNA mismatch endonuclease, patch repair protein